jgi:ligand-binding sensor domain-containing protein/serine phosphatase RsbU (regulator of sigma subunit)
MFLSVKIHKKVNINTIGILSFLFTSLRVFSQEYTFRNYNSAEGLPQSYIYSIIQDERGYLWVGTGDGLSRYNGFIFENFTTKDSLADNFITCGITGKECLWFGHLNGRISYYDGKKFYAVKTSKQNLSPVTHLAKSPKGDVWASTNADGLLKLDKKQESISHYLFANQEFILSFEFLNDKEILVATNAGLLLCTINDSGKIEIKRSIKEIPESKVTGIKKLRNKSGFFIAVENEGLFLLKTKGSNIRVTRIITDSEIDYSSVQDLYEDSQNNLWLGTFGNGLIKLVYSAPGKYIKTNYYNLALGYSTDNVKTIFEDTEGNIWSGNYGEGLTQIIPKTFNTYTFDKKKYGNNIYSIYIKQQIRWIGTEYGLLKLNHFTGKIINFYSNNSGLPRDRVNTIYSADGKILWIGTENNGVFRLDTADEKVLKYPVGGGMLENSITSITGKEDEIWIGTKKGLCNINSIKARIKWYSISRGGLPHNLINYLYIDSKNRLWISTPSNILAYIQNEKVHKIPINTESGILKLGPINEDSFCRIWIGSNGNGVFIMKPDSIIDHKVIADSIINLTTKEGLLSNYCYSLIRDNNKNIWVGHKGGLSKIKTTDYSIKPIQNLEGIFEENQFNPNAIFKDQQEKIWFGSDNGLFSYDPAMEYPKITPPALVITSLKINYEERDYTRPIILSPGNYKIRIEFLGISLKEPALVTYQYKLEGYDEWSDITKNTNITYNNLKDGTYKFILIGSSGDGAITNKPLTLSIIIKKPLWENWWFYTLASLFFFVLFFIYVKRREYNFRTKNKVLEEKVQERTHEIKLQRDLIDQKNADITSSITYASNIQNAILPPEELISALLPDSFVFSKPKDIVSGDFYWITQKDNKIVFSIGDCTGHGVPGAFLSLFGIILLNEIVNIHGITRSDAIVSKLREKIIQYLIQKRKDVNSSSGIDIALCVLDVKHNKLQYTGGMNDLVHIRDGKLEVIKADRTSVCFIEDDNKPFTLKEIEYKKGDVFYLYSDGFRDQFGGELGKKFKSHQFHQLLLEIHEMPMSNQKETLGKVLYEWKGDNEQTDDITVMGLRV